MRLRSAVPAVLRFETFVSACSSRSGLSAGSSDDEQVEDVVAEPAASGEDEPQAREIVDDEDRPRHEDEPARDAFRRCPEGPR